MLIDLLSSDNYGRYNVKVAEIFGLEQAVYLDAVLSIYEKAVRKNKVSDCFFVLNRSYLEKRTTLNEEKQKEIEAGFSKLGVITVKESCTIKVDVVLLLNLIGSDDEDLHEGAKKLIDIKSKSKRKTKKEVQVEIAKKEISTGDSELDSILAQWVDAVFAKQGWINKMTVTEGQKKLIDYSAPNLTKAKAVAKIATIGAYRDMQWAINQYKEQHPEEKMLTSTNRSVNVSTELKF